MPSKQLPNLVLPLVFDAEIDPMEEVTLRGDWLIGYSIWTEGEYGEPIIPYPKLFNFKGANEELITMLEGILQMSSDPSPSKARRFLLRYGTFRRFDWHPVEKVLKSGLPQEVKDEVQKLTATPTAQVYLIKEKVFWKEWELLRQLTLLAGGISAGKKVLSLKRELETAQRLIKEGLINTRQLPISEEQRQKSEAMGKSLDRYYEGESEAIPSAPQTKRKPQKLTPTKKARIDVENLLSSSFGRVLGPVAAQFSPNLESGPGFQLGTSSVLGVCYLALLASFSRRWKVCDRSDCPNIFVVRGKKTKHCDWYCGHIESVRRSRKNPKKKKKK